MLDVFDYLPETTRIRLATQYYSWQLSLDLEALLTRLRCEHLGDGVRPCGVRRRAYPTFIFDESGTTVDDSMMSTTVACAYAEEVEVRASRRSRISPEVIEQRTRVLFSLYKRCG